jgi:hypothetical protein
MAPVAVWWDTRLLEMKSAADVDAVVAAVTARRCSGAATGRSWSYSRALACVLARWLPSQPEDVDWRAGEIAVDSKARRHDQFPTRPRSARALADCRPSS